jgi:hypothetical protein
MKGADLFEVNERQFLSEKNMQKLIETNLQQLFGLDLVRSEFECHGHRIAALDSITSMAASITSTSA